MRIGDRRLDGFEDLLVAGTPAQAAGQRFLDLIARRIGVLVEERLGGDQKPRRAIAALRGAEVGEGFLQRMQPAVGDEPFYCRDVAAAAVDAKHQARQHRLAVEQHGARAALTKLAAVLRAAQVQVLTQHLEQGLVGRERDVGRFAVYRQGQEGVGHF